METIQFLREQIRDLDKPFNALAEWNLPVLYLILFAVIFAETGLVVTPFLPGDSLLFALGAFAVKDGSLLSIPILMVLLVVAAVLGDAVNYAVGFRLGPKVFKYERSWFFNKQHLLKAQSFYEKYGSKTIILARFVPIVRTFAPFVAGIGKMDYRRFAIFNVVGGVAWVSICIGAGCLFGEMTWVKERFELVVIAIVVISVLPMAIEFFLEWRKGRKEAKSVPFVSREDAA